MARERLPRSSTNISLSEADHFFPMASPNRSEIKPPAVESSDPIKVVIADTQSIYRVGIRKIFALEDDMRVVAQVESLGQTLAAAEKHKPDVILFEAAITPNPA